MAAENPLRVAAFHPLRVGVVSTLLPRYKAFDIGEALTSLDPDAYALDAALYIEVRLFLVCHRAVEIRQRRLHNIGRIVKYIEAFGKCIEPASQYLRHVSRARDVETYGSFGRG